MCEMRVALSICEDTHTPTCWGYITDNTYLGPMFSGPAVSKEGISNESLLV